MSENVKLQQLVAENIELTRYKRDLETLLETTDDFIYIKDEQHKFVYTSTAFAHLARHQSWKELVGKDDFDIFPLEHAERYYAFERQVIEQGESLRFHEEPYFNLEGELCWVSSTKNPVFDEQGDVIGLVGISKDITDLKRQQSQIEYVADHDDLTNFLNRRAFFQYGQKMLAAADRDGSGIAVLYIDLDCFKKVNDRYGHAEGDNVIVAFGAIIKEVTREADLTARLGGDEFVILIKQQNDVVDAASVLTQRILSEVNRLSQPLLGCGCSIGIAEYHPKERLDTLVNRADKAMYQAKQQQGSSYSLGSEALA
ncbi:GGDEF domain-containing protein [uncultured Neptuniibacter sp.]|uniref:sensor domain-containing diguanylate cyclase n=1 Tax=uncultured Neptuniibacter sp. TaxID=502143 RepID=UPI002615E3F1|nr:GGDEF domain-containing protein [uncultured Neptuniibacter sp.]